MRYGVRCLETTGDIEVMQGGGERPCEVARWVVQEIDWQKKRVWVLQQKKGLQITLP